ARSGDAAAVGSAWASTAAKLGAAGAASAGGTALAASAPPCAEAASVVPPALAAPAAPNFAAVLAQALPTAAASPDLAAPRASAAVNAPLQGDGFAPELGARVSLLAIDGVQQAELQLNPADMGPVSVQIVVDGGQAQVSFHAAQAETRQALEQSLPDLAAALQGQGLTLSGGGVFQQAPRDPDHGQAATNAGASAQGARQPGDAQAAGAGAAAQPVRRSVGLLDTFA
ncbi:MAG: flagellar hook-length control protein FliK, partial [Rubrivivax sp.]